MNKLIIALISVLFSLNILAEQVITIHYLGDARPINLDIPTITNNDGDHQINSNTKLTLNFDNNSTIGINADFFITTNGKKIIIEGKSINKSIIEMQKNVSDQNNIIANIKFIASEPIFSPIQNGMTELNIKGNELVFVTGNLNDDSLFSLNLKVKRKRLFKSDSTLIDRKLTKNDYTTEVLNSNQTEVHINLDQLTDNKFSDANRAEIEVNMTLSHDFSNVINMKQLGSNVISRKKLFRKVVQ